MKKRVVLFLALAALISGCQKRVPGDGGAEDVALSECQKAIKKELRAPASAVFPEFNADGTSGAHMGDGVYIFNSYVDSQNGFGAMLRSKWNCKVRELNDGQWKTMNAQVF
jgi:hypothetical protein